MQAAANPPAIQWQYAEKRAEMHVLDIRQVRPDTWSIELCRLTGCPGGRQ
jgi:hypothetical protein